MNYHIEKLNEQTWLIEEYIVIRQVLICTSATGKERALLIDTGFWNDPTEINM